MNVSSMSEEFELSMNDAGDVLVMQSEERKTTGRGLSLHLESEGNLTNQKAASPPVHDESDDGRPGPTMGDSTNSVHYSGEQEQAHSKGKEPEVEAQKKPRSIIGIAIESFKYSYSSSLLIFSLIVVMAAIFTEQTIGTSEKGIHPALACVIFWFLICWLAMMEGGQGALVGLEPVDKERYRESHPISFKNATIVHKGDNLERFIVGRQFLVVLVVFVINVMASAIKGAIVLGLPDVITEIFLISGLSVILITISIGQLTAQVNAASCMLDFINTYFMTFTAYVSLAIEFSGLLHSVYLVQIVFSKITGNPVDSVEQTGSAAQKFFFWSRVVLSVAILGFCFAVILSALFAEKTTMWDGVPAAASVVLFFLLMCFVGLMEGMQIALFAVINMPEEELEHHVIAHANCQLTFAGTNLQAFLIGRQICVTICMFVVARVTTLDYGEDDANLWGVPDGLQNFFNTGLLGAIITTIVASLSWRIIGSSFPVAFLSNPLIYLIIRLCLFVEATGVCSAAWLLAWMHKYVMGYQPDEVYLEATEERADDEEQGGGQPQTDVESLATKES